MQGIRSVRVNPFHLQGGSVKSAFLILLLVVACVPSQRANEAPQPVAPIAEGDRLRVTHDAECCTSPSIGVVQSLPADSLVLQSREGKTRIAIALSRIYRIERWNNHETRMARGALVGFLAGAAAGGLIGFQSACGHCDGDWRGLGASFGVLVGGLAGLLGGLFVGSHYGFWETVP
jgi:hypothetical protein